MRDPITVGRFGKAFGIAGWIKVISFTTSKENILKFKPWLIKKNNNWEKVYFEQGRRDANSVIVKLPNCDTPEQATQFTNVEIAVERKQLPKLRDGEYYWYDLIDLEVVNKDGFGLGQVKELMATGANDVLVVLGQKKILIPYISEVILNVDLDKKIIQVNWEKDYL